MTQEDVDTLCKLLRRYYRIEQKQEVTIQVQKEPFSDATRNRWDISVLHGERIVDSLVVHGPSGVEQ